MRSDRTRREHRVEAAVSAAQKPSPGLKHGAVGPRVRSSGATGWSDRKHLTQAMRGNAASNNNSAEIMIMGVPMRRCRRVRDGVPTGWCARVGKKVHRVIVKCQRIVRKCWEGSFRR